VCGGRGERGEERGREGETNREKAYANTIAGTSTFDL
jgi:hypothetical protein